MVLQTNHLLQLKYDHLNYLGFVFSSTICSYNFHWYLTPFADSETDRAAWTRRHTKFHIVFFFLGLIGSAWFFLSFLDAWFWMLIPVILTFLYSAPKLPQRPFNRLKKVAIGKTLFLAFVWMFVSTLLPVLLHHGSIGNEAILFCCSRFFLIYAICILFDFRDRENDKREGIRSMITYFDERGINFLFYTSLLLFFISTLALYLFQFSIPFLLSLLIPGFIVLLLFDRAKRNFSDYLYYFVLDGMMMFSAVFTFFVNRKS
jgi:4-hydroxybenzoate polyprenyltransferase